MVLPLPLPQRPWVAHRLHRLHFTFSRHHCALQICEQPALQFIVLKVQRAFRHRHSTSHSVQRAFRHRRSTSHSDATAQRVRGKKREREAEVQRKRGTQREERKGRKGRENDDDDGDGIGIKNFQTFPKYMMCPFCRVSLLLLSCNTWGLYRIFIHCTHCVYRRSPSSSPRRRRRVPDTVTMSR